MLVSLQKELQKPKPKAKYGETDVVENRERRSENVFKKKQERAYNKKKNQKKAVINKKMRKEKERHRASQEADQPHPSSLGSSITYFSCFQITL